MRSSLARYGPGKPFRHLLWLLLIFNTAVFSQQVFRGKVTNREGVSLVGATVSVNGTNNIAATDSAGVFTLNARPSSVFAVSFIGYRENCWQVFNCEETKNIKYQRKPGSNKLL